MRSKRGKRRNLRRAKSKPLSGEEPMFAPDVAEAACLLAAGKSRKVRTIIGGDDGHNYVVSMKLLQQLPYDDSECSCLYGIRCLCADEV